MSPADNKYPVGLLFLGLFNTLQSAGIQQIPWKPSRLDRGIQGDPGLASEKFRATDLVKNCANEHKEKPPPKRRFD